MRKLVEGILAFRRTVRPGYRETFARLALGQKPDCLFIACSDSRVVPNLFASTEPGDLFVTRNVGNLVPPSGPASASPRGPGDAATSGGGEPAAIEFAVNVLGVRDIVVCGHSSCGAMRALIEGSRSGTNRRPDANGAGAVSGPAMPGLSRWLEHAAPALEKLEAGRTLDPALPREDVLSQLNVLEQVAHVASYPDVAERVAAGALGLHAWWFDIARAEVLAYEAEPDRFLVIDELEAERILDRLAPHDTVGKEVQ